jgi:hypothetical protein
MNMSGLEPTPARYEKIAVAPAQANAAHIPFFAAARAVSASGICGTMSCEPRRDSDEAALQAFGRPLAHAPVQAHSGNEHGQKPCPRR